MFTFYKDLRFESSELVFVQIDSCDVPVRLFLNLIKFMEFDPVPFEYLSLLRRVLIVSMK